ncbi:hypothetical protein Tco_1103602 [Tanacetum coccineum]
MKGVISVSGNSSPDLPSPSYDDEKSALLFLKDQIPMWIAIGCKLTHWSLASTYGKPAIFINGGLHRIIVHQITASELGLLLLATNVLDKGKTNIAAISNDVSSTGYIAERFQYSDQKPCIGDTAFYDTATIENICHWLYNTCI